ncbi:hypothetical protein [Neobacillus sp. DY30]|uniref:hypothetical protein n=1 Tax=Neobacillus sp. DY30 TaxID=3047871 RepID=UPI0024BF4EBC|nr:hypothetical protein [Neobacillus sp. DY30]WHX98383.1 hypothetical protein QNH29_17175 [Neobacillus sp. DY30]
MNKKIQKISTNLWFDHQAQNIPADLSEMVSDPDSEKSERVMKAMLKMKKMDIKTLKEAYEG